MRALVALVLLGGCDRLLGTDRIATSFDASPDQRITTHDEDSDGRLDDADNCPMDTNADQSDAEADMVGDVCDTRSTVLDRIALFSGFTTEDTSSWMTNNASLEPDNYRLLGNGYLHASITGTGLQLAANMTVPAMNPSDGSIFIGDIAGGMPVTGVACRLMRSGTGFTLVAEAWTGGAIAAAQQTMLPTVASPVQLRVSDGGDCVLRSGPGTFSAVVAPATGAGSELLVGSKNTALEVYAVTVYAQR